MFELLLHSAYTYYMAFQHLIFLWTKYLGAQTCLIHLHYTYFSHKTASALQRSYAPSCFYWTCTHGISLVLCTFQQFDLILSIILFYSHKVHRLFNFLFPDYSLLKCLLVINILNIHLGSLAMVTGLLMVLLSIDKIS